MKAIKSVLSFFQEPELESINTVDTTCSRSSASIVIIDDQPIEGQVLTSSLRRHNFDVRESLLDLNNLDQIAAYDIIMCDINGVGKSLFPSNTDEGGLYLAREIKKIYPGKYVILHSGHSLDLSQNMLKLQNGADAVVQKGGGDAEMINVLDNAIKWLFNPYEKWIQQRKLLFNHGVSIKNLLGLEKAYIKSITYNKQSYIKNAAASMTDDKAYWLIKKLVDLTIAIIKH
jgi:CheY-like chemotaxis protein